MAPELCVSLWMNVLKCGARGAKNSCGGGKLFNMTAKMFVNFGIFCIILAHTHERAHGAPELSFVDRVTSGVALGVGKSVDILMNAPQFIPTVQELGNLGKEAFFGLPSKVVLDGVNSFCSLAVATDTNLSRDEKDKPDFRNLSIILYEESENASFPLDDMDSLVQHPSFKKNAPVVILVTGWMSNTKDSTNSVAKAMYNAYQCRGDTNLLYVDTAEYITTLYLWSAVNTEEVGEIIAPAVRDLAKYVNVSQIHVMGHSLGAHISGAIGRYFELLTNKTLPRITGLDPARPCFNHGESLHGLRRGDADFVDVIHSNSDGLGKKEPIGDVDFYPNGVKVLMPGCLDISCSHSMAWRYYAESVYPGNENAFMATRCNSLKAYSSKKCPFPPIPMGFATPTNVKGNFFLETNSDEPYGKQSTKEKKCQSTQ
ncbi:vitellogenin-1-like [Phlebotomus argentipes]|uniref:vitellogenin-1-like n=1 Tax=Phlebotomus argentipes TaxID=94469 RepID=UPI0028930064|nr:vitellogenin-1-like [Phlebotomus argentipes]